MPVFSRRAVFFLDSFYRAAPGAAANLKKDSGRLGNIFRRVLLCFSSAEKTAHQPVSINSQEKAWTQTRLPACAEKAAARFQPDRRAPCFATARHGPSPGPARQPSYALPLFGTNH